MKVRHFIVSFLLLFSVWLLLNGTLDPVFIAAGACVSVAIAWWSAVYFPVFGACRVSFRSIKAAVSFCGVFFYELVKSNLDIALRVLTPSLPINPGIVAVKTRLTDPVARLMLANAITLTPGTFTIDTQGDTFYIHWIDAGRDDARADAQAIVRKFEKYLEVMYG